MTTHENDQPLPTGGGTAAPGALPTGQPADVPVTTAEEESTIGTGTSMALGCIAGTVVLILFGLLFLALSTMF